MASLDSVQVPDLQAFLRSVVVFGPVGRVRNGPAVRADSDTTGTGSSGHVRGQTPAVAVSDMARARG